MRQIRAIGFLLFLALCLNSGISYGGLNLEEEAFFKAVKDNDTEKAKELIRRFVNVNAREKVDGPPPLVYAIMNNNKELVELMIKKGANPDVRFTLEEEEKKEKRHGVFLKISSSGWSLEDVTPLMIAAGQANEDIVKCLLSKSININARDALGRAALEYAIEKERVEIVELLILKGAEVKSWRIRGSGFANASWDNLRKVTCMGNLHLVKLLVSHGADVDGADNRGYTPLMYAAKYGHKDIVEFLISKGADVNHKGAEGVNALSLAKDNSHSEIVTILINAGAKN